MTTSGADGERSALAAVVSGAGGGGIGTACARALAQGGFEVFTIERSAAGRDVVRDQAGVPAENVLIGDIGDEATSREMSELLASRGIACGAMVHNAARGAPAGELSDVTEADFVSDLRDIVLGAFFMAKHLHPLMPQGAGRIVFISSSAALRGTRGRGPSYAAAKAGLHGLAKQLALDLSPSGTTVNVVVPFQTLTPRVLRGGRRTKESIAATARQNVPLGRPAYPEDVASAVSYLVGPGASYTTGQILSLDGGQMLAPPATVPVLGR
jgi:2-hydroxycyclohexanecarboxyl-CoA dehydrogenase